MTLSNAPDSVWAKWLRTLGAAAIIPIVAVLIGLYVDVHVMKSNRWTSKDQAEWHKQHAAEHALLMEILHKKADEENVPPPEVKNALRDLQRGVEENHQLILELLRHANGAK